ncbi:MAG: GntR family transcriptional regulator [Pseudonocardia sp.]|uniref:GntR family transcriptional regulator n=1 Tax=unclassified Pseudonocardia TaxID=2619320 RepID=UPI00086EC21A|nr:MULTISPECIES: GntR family transcriptional regulator [unclassified Pseudonocardia]MBN9111939.1 GntR family transcriptional regulator [Pseudonocardia sp.]ODV06716.1 MAG: GntR family transcriptional regulator [Pseudonocardia sp. SCN 73-27]
MLFRIDPARPVPLADQIAANVRRGIADGTVAPGERLPPARELAASLDVSIHTVLAGYQQLRDEELIELRRGRGATVREGLRPDRAALLGLVHDLVAAARRIDLDDEELLDLVRSTASGP